MAGSRPTSITPGTTAPAHHPDAPQEPQPGPRTGGADAQKIPGAPLRVSFAKISEPLEVPDLLALQTASFDWLVGSAEWRATLSPEEQADAIGGLEEIFEEISPIEDFSGSMSLSFSNPRFSFSQPRFEDVKASVEECKDKDMTYSAPLFVTAEFMNNTTGEIKSQTVFMGDFPMMTSKGTFVINGTERVVVSQLVRSPGVYFDKHAGQDLRQGRLQRQGHPEPRRLAGVRRRQARHRRRPHRPQAPAAGHRAAQGPRLDRGPHPRALRGRRVDAGHPGEGPHRRAGRGAARHLPQAAPGRAADARVRADAAGEPVLQPASATTSPRSAATRSTRSSASSLPQATSTLTEDDIVATIEYLVRLHAGEPGLRASTTSTTSATAACAPSAS